MTIQTELFASPVSESNEANAVSRETEIEYARTPLADRDGVRKSLPNLTGKTLRDKGITQVASHNEDWMERCLDELTSYFNTIILDDATFTGEEIRFYCHDTIGNPKHPNAWGALINTLVRRKIIVPTGEYRKMKDISSHARKTPVYRAS